MPESVRTTDPAALVANAVARAWASALAQDGIESALHDWAEAIATAIPAQRVELRIDGADGQTNRIVTAPAKATIAAASDAEWVEAPLLDHDEPIGSLRAELPRLRHPSCEPSLRAAADSIAALIAADRIATARRNAACARRNADQLCRSLVELSNDLIQSVDRNGRILFANAAWKRTLGIEGVSVEGRSILEFLHGDSLAHCDLAMRQVFAGAPLHRVSFAFRGPLGSKISVEGDVMPRIEDGVVIATQGFFRRVFAPARTRGKRLATADARRSI